MNTTGPMKAPPRPRKRASSTTKMLRVTLGTITPLMGGGAVAQRVDYTDYIRAAGVRGHLRFWWRALHAHAFPSSKSLYKAEAQLWGGATVKGDPDIGRSNVEIRIECLHRSDSTKFSDFGTPETYILWPVQDESGALLQQGCKFLVSLRYPKSQAPEVENALRAWILFGGYGSRTRRGLGSLKVETIDQAELSTWLPSAAAPQALNDLFGRAVLKNSSSFQPTQTPLLAGARFHAGEPVQTASYAWWTAVRWLRDFRQGTSGAREPGTEGRPSVSNWPEADKVRHLSARQPQAPEQWAHPPRHNDTPAWPRATFGLPIVGQFQGKNREGRFWGEEHPPKIEPADFQIKWEQNGKVRERLASPLIIKPMAVLIAPGEVRYAPIALWLSRANPPGDIVLLDEQRKKVAGSEAPFEQFLAQSDNIEFSALRGHASLPDAFFAFIKKWKPSTKPSSKQPHKSRKRRR